MKRKFLMSIILLSGFSIATYAQTNTNKNADTQAIESPAPSSLVVISNDSIKALKKQQREEQKQQKAETAAKKKEEKKQADLAKKEQKQQESQQKKEAKEAKKLAESKAKENNASTSETPKDTESGVTAPVAYDAAGSVTDLKMDDETLNALAVLKARADSLGDGNGFSVVGNNIIIGNNNTINIIGGKTSVKTPDVLKDRYSEGLFDHFSIGVRGSTAGFGLELATTLSRNFKLRVGGSYAKFSINSTSVEVDDEYINAAVGGYNPDYKFDSDLKFASGHALIDFHPFNNGIFHFTVGAYIGRNKVDVKGRLVDPNTGADATLAPGHTAWPDVHFNDYEIAIQPNGHIDAELKVGNLVKPYFGIGLGRSIPRSRFGVMFELGAMYQGDIVFKQNGKELNTSKASHDSFVDTKKYLNWLKWYPMINLQLVYRFR